MNKTYNPFTTWTKHDPGGQRQKPNSFLIDSMDHSSQLRAFDEINPYTFENGLSSRAIK